MSAADDLIADFPAPSRETWRALAEQALRGRTFDDLAFRTANGIALDPLQTAETAAPPVGAARRDPERDGPPWDVRTLVDHPEPAAANEEALEDLGNGAASLLLRLDPSGVDGVAVASATDLGRTLDGVLLDVAPVALDAGFLGPFAADWLSDVAKAAPAAPLALNLDPISAFAVEGRSPGPVEAHIARAAATAARLTTAHPTASLFLASGIAAHEAGGTEAQELALTAASAIAYARAATSAGLTAEQAFAGMALSLSTDADLVTTIAKLRAARAIWSRLARACGVSAPARIEARSSRRMLTARDPWTNVVRLTIAGFGAAAGGADVIQLDPFTQPLGRPSPLARRLARNIQLVLMEEAGLGRVVDPAGGAWFIETLTDRLARAGWAEFQRIEAEGGAVAALKTGRFQREVAGACERLRADLAEGRATLVGVTAFAAPLEAGVEIDAAEPARTAEPPPEVSLPGPDDACEPLRPWRAAAAFEGGHASDEPA